MGHQKDSMWLCQKLEGTSAPLLPLADYLESSDTYREMLRAEEVTRYLRKRRWRTALSVPKLRSLSPQCPVQLLRDDRGPARAGADEASQARGGMNSTLGRCIANVSFGGFYFGALANEDAPSRARGAHHSMFDRPQLWTTLGCRGTFRCAGIKMRCAPPVGRVLMRSPLVVCSCHRLSGMEDGRFWRDEKA
eukprot:5958868-Prymnesium_polylepis.2